jgi:DNA ligase-4
VREKYTGPIQINGALSSIFRRLKSSEAKWMVRVLIKDYSPVQIPETLEMYHFHFLLPDLLNFQNSFEAALKLLDGPIIRGMPIQETRDVEGVLREIADREFKPQIGVMITRVAHEKARSIKHCCQLAGPRCMSVERQYDGEYCQIHIYLKNPGACIQIFSRSGKDSTRDRILKMQFHLLHTM